MAFRVSLFSGVLLLAPAATLPGQQAPAAGGVSVIQPGAPGQSSKVLTPQTVPTSARAPHAADITFMQGMIFHHAQAVEMTGLLRTRTRDKDLQALGKRISISQTDEIQFMKQWLEDHGKPVPAGHDHTDHKNMGSAHMMPGMLTPQQMQALAKASGRSFDRLFLSGMIQHHDGALIMVEDLFDTPGAGQDTVLYDFATDIDNTQRAEIEIMKRLLKEKK